MASSHTNVLAPSAALLTLAHPAASSMPIPETAVNPTPTPRVASVPALPLPPTTNPSPVEDTDADSGSRPGPPAAPAVVQPPLPPLLRALLLPLRALSQVDPGSAPTTALLAVFDVSGMTKTAAAENASSANMRPSRRPWRRHSFAERQRVADAAAADLLRQDYTEKLQPWSVSMPRPLPLVPRPNEPSPK